MSDQLFLAAYPYGSDVLALPVSDIQEAAEYYGRGFGLVEVEREKDPATVVMEREGVRIGFCENGGDPAQEGAAIKVSDIHKAREELEDRGVPVANWRIDERDGERFQVFFVVAPDGLCYYFHQQIN